MFYPDKHAVIEPADPDAANRFQLGAGAMPAAFAGYAAQRPEADGFGFRLISHRSKHRYNSNGHISEFLKKKMPTNPAYINPEDLAALGVEDGAVIEHDKAAPCQAARHDFTLVARTGRGGCP